jgi:hypothetical protein
MINTNCNACYSRIRKKIKPVKLAEHHLLTSSCPLLLRSRSTVPSFDRVTTELALFPETEQAVSLSDS